VIHTAAADFMLAELDLHAGDLETAERRILACLAVYTDLGNDRSRAECVVVLGGIAAAAGRSEDAARLFGAAAALRGDAAVNRFERPVLERFRPAVVVALGDARTVALEREGSRVGVERLVAPVVAGAKPH
jgi:hypothetical protein